MNKYKTENLFDKKYYSTKNVILRQLGSNNAILDIGCNDGYFGRCDKNNVYYGLDYSKEALNSAIRNYKEVLFYDLNDLKLLPWNVKFDVIIFADVLEHVLNPETVLNFFVDNYLKNDGSVIVSLPNVANWQIRLNLLLGKFNYSNTGIMDNSHLHFYTFSTAKKLINNCGLTVNNKLFGASFFGLFIKFFPFFKDLLSTNIVFLSKKC